MILGMTVTECIGQLFGLVAVAISFVAYQMSTQKKILIMNMLVTIAIMINYALIGAVTGMILNIVCVVRNIIFINRDKKIFSSPVWPYIFAVIMLIAGLVTWQDWRTIFMICALVINSVCLSLKNAQHIRYSLLITCPLVMLYDILVHSYGGIVYEGMSIASAVIGIIRFRQQKENAQ